MSIVPWEEPVEDTAGVATVIYDEHRRPVLWLNHTTAELMADTEWILNHPPGPDTGSATLRTTGSPLFTRIFKGHVEDDGSVFRGVPIHSNLWGGGEGPHDPVGDVSKAWDAMVTDWFTTELRRAR